MAQYVIGYHDGWLCVIYSDTEWSNPIRVRHWWPSVRMSVNEMRDRGFEIGKPLETRSVGNGSFYFSRGLGMGFEDIRLRDGGKTKPIHTEREEIPPPKTRVETRYRNGGWEKYLKSKGWVTA